MAQTIPEELQYGTFIRCSDCGDFISYHYANGCSVSDCDCERTFGAVTLPEDNNPVAYKD